jgi:hypothetical protein
MLLLLVGAAAGCALPDRGNPGNAPRLYVANARDGTITRVDPASGRVVGPALPAGPAPMQMVSGRGGSLVVLSASERHPGQVTVLTPGVGGWTHRTVVVKTRSASDVLLAGDGAQYAVVAGRMDAAAGRVAGYGMTVIDLERAVITREISVGGPDDSLFSLAIVPAAPPVAYVGLWHDAPRAAPGAPSGSARSEAGGLVVAVRLDTGVVAGRMRLPGVPLQLAAAAGTEETGRWLFAVERVPGPDEWNPGHMDQVPRWRLLALDPTTLEAARAWPLPEEPRSLVVAPDGRAAYGLVDGPQALQSALQQIDLDTGAVRRLAQLPGEGLGGMAVSAEHIFVPHPAGSDVWTVDRRSGRLIRSIHVGRGPVAAVVVAGT